MPDGGDVIYRPSAWQSEFHQLRVWEVLGAGSQGPGKSLCLLMDPVPQIHVEHERCINKKHPYRMRWGDSTAWILHMRRTRPMLDATIARSKKIFPRIDPDARWDEERTTWTFKSGLKYQFGHCKDPHSYEIYESNEYTKIIFDEVNQFLEEQYERIILRCRSTDPVLSQKDADGRYLYQGIRSACNPQVRLDNPAEGGFVIKDPNWVRRRFVEKAVGGRVIFQQRLEVDPGVFEIRERIYLPATIDDNPDEAFRRHQKASLLSAKPWMAKALLYGDWFVQIASHFADEWDPRLHVCAPFRIPSDWKRFRSMDWGYKSPGHILWWAMSPEGNLYATEEFVFRKMLAERVAARVKQMELRMGLWDPLDKRSRITGPADNQIFREDGRGGRTIAETFAALGVPWTQAAQGPGSRYSNALLVSERLMDHDNGTTTPGLVFFNTCSKTIQTIPAIQTDPNDSEVPLEGGDDHPYDCTAYGVAFASHGLAGIPKVRPKRGENRNPWQDVDDQEDREERRRELDSTVAANHYLDDYL